MTSTDELSATRFNGRVFSDPDRPEVLFTTFDVAAYTRDAQGRIAVDQQAVAPLDDRLRADLEFLWRGDGNFGNALFLRAERNRSGDWERRRHGPG